MRTASHSMESISDFEPITLSTKLLTLTFTNKKLRTKEAYVYTSITRYYAHAYVQLKERKLNY